MQELANTAWALATLGMWDHGRVLGAARAEATKRNNDEGWQPFLDCADIFSSDAAIKWPLQFPIKDGADLLVGAVAQA
eukprot:CAMPEP_0171145932 /NCGR_PEP_ID=MMETSP0766_2-20121228/147313_1 /TAXON_ID=439317 /ORGANISM="Gambierdiscus australes, Strain CAWD 149" /LENGTH=77 /DNA_ID=CAMNT_0011609837 /DNA_START=1842 /DNA_END=2075 /DNA_ORIENTATION=+